MSIHSEFRHAQEIKRPLDGFRILEVGVWHAGPGGSAILGDLGAEVIKVEALTGDPERFSGNFGPMDKAPVPIPDWTALFEFSNRNKRGICVDITSGDGRKILDCLISGADIFVTNLRKPTREKLGLDYQSVARFNPGIIALNISAYGPEGAMAAAGGFDPLGQAMSGMLFLAGKEEPQLLQMIVLDQLTAIAASHAAITALLVRERDGIGQEVDVSLYGSAIWLMHMNLLSASVLGFELDTTWDRTANPPLRTTYKCSDGLWIIGTNHPEYKYWHAFCQAVGRPELEFYDRFATPQARSENVRELIAIIDEIIATRPQSEWIQVFQSNGLLFAPVRRVSDVLKDQQARVNGYITDFAHPDLGMLPIPGYPIRFGSREAGPVSPAPRLGQHTGEVLRELGYTDQDVASLTEKKIIR